MKVLFQLGLGLAIFGGSPRGNRKELLLGGFKHRDPFE
jgi:hypothetical protein